MKFIWLQDFNIMTQGGGAQMTDQAHFLEGVKRGHEMTLWTVETGILDGDFPGSTVIASNPTFCNPDVFAHFQNRGIPFIYFFHDYWPLCKIRLFYPMLEKCRTTCYMKDRWLETLRRARMLVWLSPLHREAWLWACPELADVPYVMAPSPVDPEKFYPLKLERKGVIAVESLLEFKGRDRVLDWVKEHPDTPVTFIGGNDKPHERLPENCTYYDFVPQHQLNELYNKHTALLHLPMNPMPYDRTVAEAYLAGCEIIGNDLIGALSWGWFKDRQQVAVMSKQSSGNFWDQIEIELTKEDS